MKKGVVVSLLLTAVCLFITDAAMAAWTQAKGHSYNQLSLSHYQTTQKFTTLQHDSAGAIVGLDTEVHRVDSEEFTSTAVTYYLEYGITDKITGIFSIPWNWVKSHDVMIETDKRGPSGVGDINVGLRHKLIDNIAGTGVLSSIEFGVKIPEAYDYANPATHQPLGEGQYDLTSKLKFGRGFNWGYSVLDISYVYRFENEQLPNDATFKPSDQFKVALSGGYNATPWLSIRGQFAYSDSVGNAEVSDVMAQLFYDQGSVSKAHGKPVVIKDSLALEQDTFSGGVDLAFTLKPGLQLVFSYNTDISDFFGLKHTKNAALGETYAVALAYSH